ncbi:papain-like cysteine protease family protein [Bacillus mycoides]|uniref:papain-like cysteine protease family protein n=1 Tax=Bacillus mycoides TaxID=1405 RepID=UPI003D661743
MKFAKKILILAILIGFSWIFFDINTTSAKEVQFSGMTAPIGVNVRDDKNLSGNVIEVLPGNQRVNFNGWEYGEELKGYWTGKLDNRWFYFYKNGKKAYVASAFVNENPPDSTTSHKLSVPNTKQQQSNWCWAGTSVSVLSYFGEHTTQQQFVKYVKGGIYNYPATSREIQNGLSSFDLISTISRGTHSYEWFKNQINSNKPMITLINWKNGGNIGHFLVLDGYFKGGNGTGYATYMDPWYGDHYTHNFESFKNNNRFWWSETVQGISKK